MERFLMEQNIVTKDKIISILNTITAWVVEKRSNSLPPSSRELKQISPTTYVRPFGSYGLGVQDVRGGSEDMKSMGDLDVLVFLPHNIRREHIFPRFLAVMQVHEFFRDIIQIEAAFVPVIKFTFDGVEVDMVFAILPLPAIPNDERQLLRDDSLLDRMDSQSQRSLNGWRVAKYLLDYVPDREMFQAVLQDIRQWARNRLVYSNNCGYFGGIVWAIMVARICKSAPRHKANRADLIRAFFEEYASWDWTKSIQIHETAVATLNGSRPASPISLHLHGSCYMRVLLPCSPHPNCSFNLTRTTFQFIKSALTDTHRALQQRTQIRDILSTRTDPAQLYTNFVGIIASARSASLMKKWRGAVEARFPRLNRDLDYDLQQVHRAQIFPVCFRDKDHRRCTWVLGIHHQFGPHALQFLTQIERFREDFYQHNGIRSLPVDQQVEVTFHCWKKQNVDNLLRPRVGSQSATPPVLPPPPLADFAIPRVQNAPRIAAL